MYHHGVYVKTIANVKVQQRNMLHDQPMTETQRSRAKQCEYRGPIQEIAVGIQKNTSGNSEGYSGNSGEHSAITVRAITTIQFLPSHAAICNCHNMLPPRNRRSRFGTPPLARNRRTLQLEKEQEIPMNYRAICFQNILLGQTGYAPPRIQVGLVTRVMSVWLCRRVSYHFSPLARVALNASTPRVTYPSLRRRSVVILETRD